MLKDPPRVGLCSHFRVERPHFGLHSSSWLVCSRPPPVQHARVAAPILASRTATSSTFIPRTPVAAFTPTRGGRTGTSMSGGSFSMRSEGALVGSLARWPLRGSKSIYSLVSFVASSPEKMILEPRINHAALIEPQINYAAHHTTANPRKGRPTRPAALYLARVERLISVSRSNPLIEGGGGGGRERGAFPETEIPPRSAHLLSPAAASRLPRSLKTHAHPSK